MRTLDEIHRTLNHLDRMESNKTHFYSMRACCRPELAKKMDKHLRHAIQSAKQDALRLHELSEALLLELAANHKEA